MAGANLKGHGEKISIEDTKIYLLILGKFKIDNNYVFFYIKSVLDPWNLLRAFFYKQLMIMAGSQIAYFLAKNS